MEEVYEFLKKCGAYYLATQEGDQPRVRPFGTIDLFEGKMYLQTGRTKAVSQQMTQNPRVEICAFADGDWLRVCAEVEEDPRIEAKRHMLDAYPSLRRMYDENDDNTQVFFLKNAVATFSSFTKPARTLSF